MASLCTTLSLELLAASHEVLDELTPILFCFTGCFPLLPHLNIHPIRVPQEVLPVILLGLSLFSNMLYIYFFMSTH